jgi:hypothetical protein
MRAGLENERDWKGIRRKGRKEIKVRKVYNR